MNAIAPLADFAGAQDVIEAWFTGMGLDPPQLVWEWAEENLVLMPEMAAEPGPYSLKRTPFLREILTHLSPSSPVIGTILMKGSQVGASQAGLAFLVYLMVVAGGGRASSCAPRSARPSCSPSSTSNR